MFTGTGREVRKLKFFGDSHQSSYLGGASEAAEEVG